MKARPPKSSIERAVLPTRAGTYEVELDVEYPDGTRGTVRRQGWNHDKALGRALHSAIIRELVDR